MMRPSSACFLAAVAIALVPASIQADDWPQWLGPERDGIWRESGVVEKLPPGGPKVLWRVPVGGGYSGPAVTGGKVYLTDRILSPDARKPSSDFDRKAVTGKERVLCFDEKTGQQLWEHHYPSTYTISYAVGPRCTPVVAEGKVWTLGSMGDLLCLDAAK